MLKPKKRKVRTQLVMREHDVVVYSANGRGRTLSLDEVRVAMVDTIGAASFAQLPYATRQMRRVAQNRFSKATIGALGLRPMSQEEWDDHWAWKRLKTTAKESQLRQLMYRGSMVDKLTGSPFLYGDPTKHTDRVIQIYPGQGDRGVLTSQILKGRKSGLGTLFQNGIGDSPRINPGERKSDIEMTLAMQQGPDAVRELYLQRYGITGADGKRYLLDTEYYDAERAEALLKMVLGSESTEEITPTAVRTFRKALNHAKVGAFGNNPWRPNVDGIEGFVKSSEMPPIEFDFKSIQGESKE